MNRRRRSQKEGWETDYEREGLNIPERKHVAPIEKQWVSGLQKAVVPKPEQAFQWVPPRQD